MGDDLRRWFAWWVSRRNRTVIGGLVPWSNDSRKLYSVKANRERTRIASGKSYYSSAFLGLRCVSIYPFRPIFVPLTGPRHQKSWPATTTPAAATIGLNTDIQRQLFFCQHACLLNNLTSALQNVIRVLWVSRDDEKWIQLDVVGP